MADDFVVFRVEVVVVVVGFLTAARAEGGAPPTGVRTDLAREGVAAEPGVVDAVGREGLRECEGVVLGGFMEGRRGGAPGWVEEVAAAAEGGCLEGVDMVKAK
jgi:hypothetical protein